MNRAQRRAAEREARRMERPATRRLVGKHTWAIINEREMAPDQIRDLATFAWVALDSLPRGDATDVDLSNLAVISNISMLLAKRGFGAEALPDVLRAQDALVMIQDRYARTGKAGANGMELQALRTLIAIHEQQLGLQPTRAEMLAVLAEMRRQLAAGNVLQVRA